MDHERQQNPLGWFKTSLCDLGKALKDIRRYISLTHDFKRALTVPGLLMVIPKICEGATVLTNVLKAMPHIFKGALMVFHPYLVLNESSDTIHGATSVVESDVLKGHGDTYDIQPRPASDSNTMSAIVLPNTQGATDSYDQLKWPQ
jgi:hypothetical protein